MRIDLFKNDNFIEGLIEYEGQKYVNKWDFSDIKGIKEAEEVVIYLCILRLSYCVEGEFKEGDNLLKRMGLEKWKKFHENVKRNQEEIAKKIKIIRYYDKTT